MLKYIPARLRAAAPLVVVLHGCEQTASDANHGGGWSTLAEELGLALLMPEQRHSNNVKLGFNWFCPSDTRASSGEALSIRQMVGRMVQDYGLDPGRVYITGLSAGGAMTSALLAVYPEVFAGGAIIAGLPYGIASDVWAALAAMRGDVDKAANDLGDRVRAASRHEGRWPKLSIWHGTSDQTVAPSNADALTRQWCNVHGICQAAVVETRVAGQTRSHWCDASGAPMIERFMIPGMAHAAPVDASGKSGCVYGASAPFFEDKGICSTYHIAKFWGLSVAT